MSFFDKKIATRKKIWDKVSKVIKKGFDNKLVHNSKYLKTKLKSYKEKINTFSCR